MILIQSSACTHESTNCIVSVPENLHILKHIFSYLNAKDLTTCLLVCKQWNQHANNEALWNDLVPETAFGPKKWNTYFGDIGETPPLPQMIHKILIAPCPIWPGKRVHETHLLTLIPKTVNAQPLTLQSLGELVQKPLYGPATKYKYFDLGEHQDLPAPAPHWAILSRDVIPGSRYKSYADHQQLLKQYPSYEVPHILDASVALFMEHAQSGTRLYSNSPNTFTRCQQKYNANWKLAVGGFVAGGLIISYDYDDEYENCGVGISRKFVDRAVIEAGFF